MVKTTLRDTGLLVSNWAAAATFAVMFVLNAWWLWRDTRPAPDLNTIKGWMRQEQYSPAESALSDYLRQSPWNGEARMILSRVLAAQNNLLGCAKQLHEVPFWYPTKAEALYREGQSYLIIDRAKDAEAAWLDALNEDPLHPVAWELLHDVCQQLLNLYAVEDRWEDAYPVMWIAYEHAEPTDQPALLAMRIARNWSALRLTSRSSY